jgi:sodium transport system permease protein
MSPDERRDLWTVMRWDLRTILRDPKTLLTMFLIPLVAYPAMLWGMSEVETAREKKHSGQVLKIAAHSDFEAWIKPKDKLEIVNGQLHPVEDSLVDAEVSLPTGSEPAVIRYRGDKGRSRRAKSRLKTVLKRRQKQARSALFEDAGMPVQPRQVLQVKAVDVASQLDKAGISLGRFLPLTLVLLALGGGLYTALDLFAGERERGTMETLLASRVSRDSVTFAKFLLVVAATAVTSILAIASLSISLHMGWFSLPGTDTVGVSASRLVLLGVLSIPLVIQVSAGLVALAARVPDYKTGQFLSLPALMAALLPASIPLFPGVELGPLLACVPVANIALTVVEVLSNAPRWGLVGLALGATVVHTLGALHLGRQAMGKESAVLGPSGSAARHAKGQFGLEAMGLFLVVLVFFWFIGQTAQSVDLTGGLILTQVALVALPALAMVAWLGQSHRAVMQLRLPRWSDLCLALVAGAAAPCVGNLVFELQGAVIPMPEELLKQFSDSLSLDMPLWALVGLLALLPAVCEELLFRGAILGLLKKTLGPVGRCIAVAVLFGVMHLLLVRILPTAALGLVLTAAAMRSRSLMVPVVIHLLNNGLVIVAATLGWLEGPLDLSITAQAVGVVVCVAAVAAMGRRRGR